MKIKKIEIDLENFGQEKFNIIKDQRGLYDAFGEVKTIEKTNGIKAWFIFKDCKIQVYLFCDKIGIGIWDVVDAFTGILKFSTQTTNNFIVFLKGLSKIELCIGDYEIKKESIIKRYPGLSFPLNEMK